MKIPSWLINLCNCKAHCDYCGYDEKVDLKNISESDVDALLGKKCPKCGYIMVNEADIKVMKKMLRTFSVKERDKDSFGTIRFKTKKH